MPCTCVSSCCLSPFFKRFKGNGRKVAVIVGADSRLSFLLGTCCSAFIRTCSPASLLPPSSLSPPFIFLFPSPSSASLLPLSCLSPPSLLPLSSSLLPLSWLFSCAERPPSPPQSISQPSSPLPSSSGSNGSGPSIGLIIGVVVGVLLLFVALALAAFFLFKRQRSSASHVLGE